MRILLFLLLGCFTVNAQLMRSPGFVAGVLKPAVGGVGNIAADFWMTFESNSDCSAAQLDTSDGVAGANWDTTVDSEGRLNCTSTDADYTSPWTINSTADTGTKGLSVDLAGSAAARIVFYSPSQHNSTSVGFWYRTPTGFGNFDAQQFFSCSDQAVNYTAPLNFGGDGTSTRYINWASGGSGGIAVSAGTWYYVTMQYVRNSTSSLSVYDTSGNQVGSTSTKSIGDFQIGRYMWGSVVATTVSGAVAYFDNLCIDWTDATFPLKP